ncbi:uncharacterized protein LOC128564531 [Nycticebus coucang]|uniref:uncharacterized protein LOC128564531 n=1 Tax=Nycticebus coucang TaxID=9470 RepID=UPI00234DE002|nr:uncharacterized protein LOC128564531 [Nycticebus coucang]
MVRGGRREVRGVSAQAGKSPASRSSAGQPAPGPCSASSAPAAAAPAPAPVLACSQPHGAAQRPGRGQGRGSVRGVRVCLCVRVCVCARQGGGTRQGPVVGIWGLPVPCYHKLCGRVSHIWRILEVSTSRQAALENHLRDHFISPARQLEIRPLCSSLLITLNSSRRPPRSPVKKSSVLGVLGGDGLAGRKGPCTSLFKWVRSCCGTPAACLQQTWLRCALPPSSGSSAKLPSGLETSRFQRWD